MKKKFSFCDAVVLGIAVLSVVSCQREIVSNDDIPATEECYMEVTASYGEENSKTVLVNGTSVYWSPADEINLFQGSTSTGKFISQNTEASAKATFGGTLSTVVGGIESESDKNCFWAVYPYASSNSCNGSSVTINVPDVQDALAGSFAPGMFPCVAKSGMPQLAFYNVCGGLRFSITKVGVTKVTFKGNNGEALAGKVSVSMDANGKPVSEVVNGKSEVILLCEDGLTVGSWYFISLLPGTLKNGYTIRFETATQYAEKISSSSTEVRRSSFGSLENADAGVTYINNDVNPEIVDLGLSVKWATCNLGASSPEEYGRYFAWGDVVGQTWDGSSWSNGGFSSSPKCEFDANNNLRPAYDAAHVLLGGNWRMPTKAEQRELINNCTSEWTTYNGVYGRLFTSKKAGYTNMSIFLPAAGYGFNSTLTNADSYGYYWSSTYSYVSTAWRLRFYSDDVGTLSDSRKFGHSVRPVCE